MKAEIDGHPELNNIDRVILYIVPSELTAYLEGGSRLVAYANPIELTAVVKVLLII